MTDFLLELRSEEIPARMQEKASADLARLFEAEIAKAGLAAQAIETYATPRRLALIARGLPAATEAVREETKGPKASAPPQALEGFLRKTGLAREQLEERDGILFAIVEKPGRATPEVLAEAIPAIVRAFPWPKSMRWGGASASPASLRWVRPLQGIVALFGEEVVPCAIEGVESGAVTVGHRFHHPGPITIGSATDYAAKLRACHVILDPAERRGIIEGGARALAEAKGLHVVPDAGLVAENAGLTEWPVPLLGDFDPAFLEVPREVIQLTLRTNQKYFVLAAPPRHGEGDHAQHGGGSFPQGGSLAPAFLCTANIEAADGGEAIVAGNRKVLAARLSDARFFWEQDLKVPLAEQAEKLKHIVFHEKLGTVADKVARVAKLARWLVEEGIVGNSSPSLLGKGDHAKHGGGARSGAEGAPGPSTTGSAGGPPPQDKLGEDVQRLADLAEQAALLCKADLVTGMVCEFPELQGVMGGYYARAEGLPDAVADAIRDHYKPVGQGDDVPTAPVTVAVSLADKLDTLVCFFSIDQRPSGSKDPFALRRATIALLRLMLSNGLRASLRDLVREARAGIIENASRKYQLYNFTDDVAFDEPVPVQPADAHKTLYGFVVAVPAEVEAQTWLGEKAYRAFSRDFIDENALASVSFTSLADTVGNLVQYIGDRLTEAERASGVRADLIQAVLPKNYFSIDLFSIASLAPPRDRGIGVQKVRVRNWSSSDDPVAIIARVKALQAFVGSEDGANLLAGYKRAANILRKEEVEADAANAARHPGPVPGSTDPQASAPGEGWTPEQVRGDEGGLGYAPEPAEAALIAALDGAEGATAAAVADERFVDAMAALATLRGPIDAFFDQVTVNDADPAKRTARLALLARIRAACHTVADFSKIEG